MYLLQRCDVGGAGNGVDTGDVAGWYFYFVWKRILGFSDFDLARGRKRAGIFFPFDLILGRLAHI